METKGKRYDKDFKLGAVKMVLEKGRSINSVAVDLGVSYDTPVLKRTLQYLSRLSSANFAAVEIDHFSSDGKEIFVPRALVFDKAEKKRSITTRITEQQFLEKSDPAAAQIWENLFRALSVYDETIFWGTVGFSFRVNSQDKLLSLLWGYPKGSSFGKDVLQFAAPYSGGAPEVNKILGDFQKAISFFGRDLHNTNTYSQVVVGEGLKLSNVDAFNSALKSTIEALRLL